MPGQGVASLSLSPVPKENLGLLACQLWAQREEEEMTLQSCQRTYKNGVRLLIAQYKHGKRQVRFLYNKQLNDEQING